ncbi:alkaline phosphatase family protein [Candidatus Enterococcus ikei]|uniref:Alkaline phosphatase family protein n=1 Tax=Candidatus Enterococcus ikei TaxID=2815326 RepID=A0ABS3H0H6_9ENTE|nr:alkaline phosphatase family protein [Enterococcus sp. DIV0869a]MBO0441016.1 alkaline phosphatase family protein [Enterococcus sp. DIV0869a]
MQNNQRAKLIVVILDGCRYDTAVAQLGFLNHLIEHDQGSLIQVRAEMPSNSRPLYEVLMTGTPTYQNHIYTNNSCQRSQQVSLFDLVTENGGTTGAAAYSWYSELYNQAPYNSKVDRIQNDEKKLIQHGIFYNEDTYPDSHLFADAHYLINEYEPDYVVVHSMNIDDTGHRYTADSNEYQWAVNRADGLLGEFLPEWLEKGYQIVVTADHGMDEFGLHGGNLSTHREVPLYLFSDKRSIVKVEEMQQLELAPLFCFLLGIEPAPKMLKIDHLLGG